MWDNMKVYILTEGGKNIGFGHITRCLSIFQAFEKRGATPVLLINGDNTIQTILKKKKYKLLDWLKETDQTREILRNSDMVLIDSYLADRKFYNDVSEIVPIPVYIDDNRRLPYPRGIVVNGTTYAKKLGFQKNSKNTYFLGKQFALFRKEFWSIPTKHIKKQISSVLIFLGANDSRNLTPKILKLFTTGYPEWKKNVVVTDGFNNLEELTLTKDRKTFIIKNPDAKKIKELMMSSDIAITSGGQTIYELCRVGIPAVVIMVAENQKRSITDLHKLGAISFAGRWYDKNIITSIQKHVEAFHSYNIRVKQSSRMRKVFDGASTLRLVDELINYCKRYQYEKKP